MTALKKSCNETPMVEDEREGVGTVFSMAAVVDLSVRSRMTLANVTGGRKHPTWCDCLVGLHNNSGTDPLVDQ